MDNNQIKWNWKFLKNNKYITYRHILFDFSFLLKNKNIKIQDIIKE